MPVKCRKEIFQRGRYRICGKCNFRESEDHRRLLEKDFLPIICPIGLDKNFDTYNINADDAACAIAKAVHAEKLAFLTDIEGVYLDPNDPSTLLSKLFVKEAKETDR